MTNSPSSPADPVPDPIEKSRPPAASSSTERWRRWRARQASGEVVLAVPIDNELIELMLDAGKIDERGSEDRKKLAEVIRRLCLEACTNALDTASKR